MHDALISQATNTNNEFQAPSGDAENRLGCRPAGVSPQVPTGNIGDAVTGGRKPAGAVYSLVASLGGRKPAEDTDGRKPVGATAFYDVADTGGHRPGPPVQHQ